MQFLRCFLCFEFSANANLLFVRLCILFSSPHVTDTVAIYVFQLNGFYEKKKKITNYIYAGVWWKFCTVAEDVNFYMLL